MHSKAVIHTPHWHLYGLKATFPVTPIDADPPPDEVGEMDLGDRGVSFIEMVPERYFMMERTEEDLAGFYPLACAVLDYKKGTVYTFYPARQHSDLIALFQLNVGDQQTRLEEGPICGFVTASGHFFNRESMKYFVEKHHADLLKPSKENYFFNSSMIDWNKVHDRYCERVAAVSQASAPAN